MSHRRLFHRISAYLYSFPADTSCVPRRCVFRPGPFVPQPSLTSATGGHDNSYMSTLSSLNREELLGKLVFLQGYNEPSPEMLQLALPSIQVDGLFLPEKPSLLRRPGPLAITSVMGSVTTTGGLISPQSETQSIAGPPNRLGTSGKPIDPTKVSARTASFTAQLLIPAPSIPAPA